MQKLHCPNCGHHVASLSTPPAREEVRQLDQAAREVLPTLRDWIAERHMSGRRSPSEIHERFTADTGMDASLRAVGVALNALGVRRTRTGKQRAWVLP